VKYSDNDIGLDPVVLVPTPKKILIKLDNNDNDMNQRAMWTRVLSGPAVHFVDDGNDLKKQLTARQKAISFDFLVLKVPFVLKPLVVFFQFIFQIREGYSFQSRLKYFFDNFVIL
jgi:hypothetical protein